MVMPFNGQRPQTPYEQWLQQQPQYQAIQPNAAGLNQPYQQGGAPQWNPQFGQGGTPFQPAQATPGGPPPGSWAASGQRPGFAMMQEQTGGSGWSLGANNQPIYPQVVKPDGSTGHSDQPYTMTNGKLTPITEAGGTPGYTATGAGQAETAAGAPAWAKYTAGKDGNSYYSVLKGKFDPWGDWGRFGPRQNGPKRHQTAQGMESDVDRVYRHTNDILRSMGYAGGENAPPELRTQIFLANVERLKQDYKNLNLDWNTSDFANMDNQVRAAVGAPSTGLNNGTPTNGNGQPVDPVTGQPTSNTGTPQTTQTPGANGGMTAAQKLALSQDPAMAYRYMMQQMGYNPSAPGLLGNFLKQKFQPLLEARLAASNVGAGDGSYMDTIDQTIRDFGGGAFQKGGNFFGNLANIGNQAAQQGAGFLNGLQDQEQAQQYLQQLGMLRYAGSNPLIQQSMGDEMRRANEAYQDLAFNNELSGQNIDPFQQWLLGQSRYKSIFGY